MPPDVLSALLQGLTGTPAGLALFSPEDKLHWANPWFCNAMGVDLADAPSWETMMRNCHRDRRGVLIDTTDIDTWIGNVRQRYRQVPQRSFESDLCDGRWIWVNETLAADGWLTMLCTEITQLKTHEATLRRARDEALIASLTDPLTGLYNRRYMFRRVEDLLSTARQMRLALVLAVIDLDHFKSINDQHGHSTGDAVLRHFAQHLRQHLRPLDAVGRIGGEEFMLVLPNTELDAACTVLQRLRDTLDDPDHTPPLPRYGFSTGLALASTADTVDTLFSRADAALYRAKAGGRNGQVAAD